MIADDEPIESGKGGDEPEAVQQDGGADDTLETGELALDDGDDDRLPWLESDDGEADDSADGGRILGFAVLGFLLLVAIVGAIWWATHRTPDETLIADGSTIAAPKQPFKEPPRDAGGKTFEGTGDSAFAVSQGQTQGAAQASASGAASAAPQPGIAIPPKAAASSAPAAGNAAAASATPGTLVQIGAYKNRETAEARWASAASRYSALSGQRHVVVEGQADIGTVFRLQILAGSNDGARTLCGRLKGQGLDCQVK